MTWCIIIQDAVREAKTWCQVCYDHVKTSENESCQGISYGEKCYNILSYIEPKFRLFSLRSIVETVDLLEGERKVLVQWPSS